MPTELPVLTVASFDTRCRHQVFCQSTSNFAANMLTKADFRLNLRIISVACKMGIFPFNVDLQTGELELQKSKRKRLICMSLFALYVIHSAYVMLRLPYLLLKGAEMSLLSLLIHSTTIVGMTVIGFSHFTAFVRWPETTVMCFNKAFEAWGFDYAGNVSCSQPLIYSVRLGDTLIYRVAHKLLQGSPL